MNGEYQITNNESLGGRDHLRGGHVCAVANMPGHWLLRQRHAHADNSYREIDHTFFEIIAFRHGRLSFFNNYSPFVIHHSLFPRHREQDAAKDQRTVTSQWSPSGMRDHWRGLFSQPHRLSLSLFSRLCTLAPLRAASPSCTTTSFVCVISLRTEHNYSPVP